MIRSYLKYLFKAQNEHAIHSPFVFDFYVNVLKNQENKVEPSTEFIESTRSTLLSSKQNINVLDHGAGSRINKSNTRKVADVAKNAQKPKQIAQKLFRIVKFLQPKTIIDLGTSLGLTTMYFAKAAPNAKIYSFEGCPQTLKMAQKHFDEAKIENVETVLGNIDESLGMQLQKVSQIDFAFFDANHRYAPTVNYFEQCLAKSNEKSVFVFDDIHWSAEMEQAWEYIKSHPKVLITIDLFYIGIVFFRKNQPKQHFILR